MKRIIEAIAGKYNSSLDRSVSNRPDRKDIFQGKEYFKALWNVIFIDSVQANMNINNSSSWYFDGERNHFSLDSNGSTLATGAFGKSDKISALARGMYDRTTELTDMTTGATPKDFENWIKAMVDIQNLGVERMENIIEIKEDVKVGNIILEAGDRIALVESYESDIANKILTSLEKEKDPSSGLSFADWVRKNADDLGETDVLDVIKADPKLKARMDKLMTRTGMGNPLAANKKLNKYWEK